MTYQLQSNFPTPSRMDIVLSDTKWLSSLEVLSGTHAVVRLAFIHYGISALLLFSLSIF